MCGQREFSGKYNDVNPNHKVASQAVVAGGKLIAG